MGKKHKNKVRVLPGRMYRMVRSDRSVYCDAENALRTCFIEETKERRTAREEGELCRFVRMAPDGGVELISNAGNVVRFKNAEDLTKTLRFAKDVLRITEVLKNGNQNWIEKTHRENHQRKSSQEIEQRGTPKMGFLPGSSERRKRERVYVCTGVGCYSIQEQRNGRSDNGRCYAVIR